MSRQELLDVVQVCRVLNLGRTAFYSLRSSQKFGPMPIKLNRKLLYRRRELIDWIKAGCPTRHQWQERRQNDTRN